jgi:hypothetical protein
MWGIVGDLRVDNFTTYNAEFHLRHVTARLSRLKIFELEISNESQITADHLDLVFLSTHTGDDDHLQFSNIPVNQSFSQSLPLGSGAHAQLRDTRLEIFLLYLHGRSDAKLSHVDKVQIAFFTECRGTFQLPQGRLGSDAAPAVLPTPGSSNCPFHVTLNDVNVDTWDIYAHGHSKLTLDHSQIDEIHAADQSEITVRDSVVLADWLQVSGTARMTVEKSTVGALSLIKQRPDLATSQIRAIDNSTASFSDVRFDCGIVSTDHATVEISHARTNPTYLRHSTSGEIRVDGKVVVP